MLSVLVCVFFVVVNVVGVFGLRYATYGKVESLGFSDEKEQEQVQIVLQTEEQPSLDDMKIFSGTANIPVQSQQQPN